VPLKRKKIKTLILGCTHYPLIKKQIKIIAGSKIKIVDTSEKVAQKTVAYLRKHAEIKSKLTKNRQQEFFTTGDLVTFKRFLKSYLQTDNIKIKKIKLK
jgi:glutamate racemase